MTHREMYDEVFEKNGHLPQFQKICLLAQLVYANHHSDSEYTKDDAVWEALEKYEDMSGCWFDPTHEEFDRIKLAIIG